MFLLPSINMQLRPSILNLKPGTRIVANTFTMEDWEADQTESVTDNCSSWCTALLWIVPAKVQGTWKTPQGNLTLTQEFQMLTGNLNGTAITGGSMNGDQISFTVGGHDLQRPRERGRQCDQRRQSDGHQGELRPSRMAIGRFADPCRHRSTDLPVRPRESVFRGGLKNGVGTTVAPTRCRTASTVTSISSLLPASVEPLSHGRQRNHLLQDWRPRRRRRLADLIAVAVNRHGDARGGRRHLRRQLEFLVQRFHFLPVDLDADDLARGAPRLSLSATRPAPRTALFRPARAGPVPSRTANTAGSG